MTIINIFTEEEWEHIKKHNDMKNVKSLANSLHNNPCELCRSFWLKLYAMKIGFLVQESGKYYVLKKCLREVIKCQK